MKFNRNYVSPICQPNLGKVCVLVFEGDVRCCVCNNNYYYGYSDIFTRAILHVAFPVGLLWGH